LQASHVLFQDVGMLDFPFCLLRHLADSKFELM